MRAPAGPVPDLPRLLRRQGLVEGDVLAVVAPRTPRPLTASLPRGTTFADAAGIGRLPRGFRTVLDLGALASRPPARRADHVRQLGDAVLADGYLHVVGPPAAQARDALAPAEVLRLFRRGWSLLTLQAGDAGPLEGLAGGTWVATFVRLAARRRPGRPAVKHFSDLGAFSSLDLGAPTDQPPWGT